MKVKKGLIALLTIIFIIIFFDYFFRLTKIVDVSYNDVFSDIGRGRRAKKDYIMFNEGFSIGEFNENRYLGPDYPQEKNERTIRIALIGDSFVEGFQVFPDYHFRTILEKKLTLEIDTLNIEVLNFGRSGFTLSNSYAYYKKFVNKFNPDISLFILGQDDLLISFSDPLKLNTFLIDSEKDSLIFGLADSSYYKSNRRLIIFQKYSSLVNLASNALNTFKAGKSKSILLGKFSILFENKGYNSNDEISVNKRISYSNITKSIIAQISYDPEAYIVVRDSIFLNNLPINKDKLIFLSDTLGQMIKTSVDPYYWKTTNIKGHWNYEAHKAIGEFLAHKFIENKFSNKFENNK